MSIEVLQKELDQTSNTLGVVILSLSEAQAALDEIKGLRDALNNRPYSPDLWTIEQIIETLNHADNNAIPRALTWMRDKGSEVSLGWNQDDNQWECLWIIGGTPYTSVHENMTAAIVGALLKVKHRGENEAKPHYVRDRHGNRLRHG